MTEYSTYYETKLYPTQNEVLKSLKSLNLPFYLTGGTALSRGYYNHRYSDDLDLFVNKDNDFFKHTESFINILKEKGFSVEVQPSSSDSFSRIFVNKGINGLNKNGLKIDFVNDIDAHFGTIKDTPVFYRTDSIRNILSNKYTALYRLSVKDIVDICEIAKHYSFNWRDIINEAEQKETGIDLKEVVEIFKSYDDSSFEKIRWINKPSANQIRNQIERIAYDMITQGPNSLCIPKRNMVQNKEQDQEFIKGSRS